ncbi:MAG: type 2 isopentenyl-diphosphate Delta-isomerase [Euryarchaeota archaeon]|jgi:isopentenyl-diphosphate delta-isomerase|nr:type 2 isopentenyl-diphosphate Delta-isomerase [Thermoplasmata archaeon]MVT36187.1 type 2 isopentenyl-diphosphate Delta-isomerase [Euryarchaeota archaeon]
MIENRKSDHVSIASEKDVMAHYNYWDDIYLIHNAMPEINYDNISTETYFYRRNLKYPIIIESMTGGFPQAKVINENIAKVASELQIGMGVGSQRVLLKNRELMDTFSVIRDYDIPLRIANIGAPQLIEQHHEKAVNDDELSFIMNTLDAHFLDIHFNFLQEVVQPEGDKRASGIEMRLKDICSKFPVIAKETGAGIDFDIALRLKRAGVMAIDVSGVSGTSFAAVEHYRAKEINDKIRERLGLTYWDWGIPSPYSVIRTKGLGVKIISSGGIRNGLDVARSLVIGADLVGMAGHVLKYAKEGYKPLLDEMQSIVEELKAAMFLTGSKSVDSLKNKKYIVIGRLRDWLEQK